jgi:hypothetical protein
LVRLYSGPLTLLTQQLVEFVGQRPRLRGREELRHWQEPVVIELPFFLVCQHGGGYPQLP